MTTIYLIRHAEAEGNLYRIAQGQANSSITDRGERQIQALARRFADIPIDAVYASDLYRTCATASAIYKPKGLPLHRRRDLREICVGVWEEKTWGEIARQDPAQLENFNHRLHLWHVEGAETPQAVQTRLLAAVRDIAAANDGKTAAVFSHGCAIRLLLAALLVLSLAACGTKDNEKKADMSSNDSAMTGEPKNAEEALALHKKLMEQENTILSQNTALWEKVFMEADKGMAMVEDGKNYGEFLLDTIESAKDQFTDEEYKMLKESATEISNIENKLTELENKYPEIMQESMDGDMSVPAGSDMTNPPDDGSMQKFPAFEGKDLDGNPVKSDELFSGNAVTVVNFWFTTCNPCVGELAELDALNKELAEKGGTLIGVNTFTLDGDETAISEAKDVLAKKGATYQNVYFASDGEAGKFTTNIFAYPTTYVVDRSGNIVGDPIVGAITEKKQAETLQKLIDQTLAADMG